MRLSNRIVGPLTIISAEIWWFVIHVGHSGNTVQSLFLKYNLRYLGLLKCRVIEKNGTKVERQEINRNVLFNAKKIFC